jgi:hypothetical protein
MVLPVAGDSQSRPSRPAHGCSSENPCLCRATKPRHQASVGLPPKAVQAEGPPKAADGSLKLREAHLRLGRSLSRRSPRRARVRRENQRARREVELASVRDCYDDPHRRSLTAAPTPRPASLPWSLPSRPSDEPHRWCPRVPPEDPTRDGGPTRQPSRRGWARRVPGCRGGGRSGACAAPPALPGSRGCRRRSTSARWRPSRSAPPCPGAGCRSG